MAKWTAKGRVWFLFGLPAFQMERPRLMQGLTMVNRPLEANIGVVIIAVSKIIGCSEILRSGCYRKDGLLLRRLPVRLPRPLSAVPLYNVSEKWAPAEKTRIIAPSIVFVLFLSPGLVCWRSGGAYWPPRLSGCLFFREIAAAYALEIGSSPPFGLFLVVGSKSLQSVGFQPVLELLAHLARTRERIWTRATRTPQPM